MYKRDENQVKVNTEVKEEIKPEVKEEVKEEIAPEVKEEVKEVKPEVKAQANAKKFAKVINCDHLNVRSEPSTMGSVVEIIDRDHTVEIFGKENEFTKVLTKRGINGYCMSEYLKEE